ncbi:type III-B CRISPR module RAMP protein Cmr4 [Acidiphilium sp.]|uniref:type III-B CRISPR module RAMP protein Cmr4 n=1 Tax=Acidiphilium sp. TaxID=527 RepID=UPI00258D8390|nr:type III-B CRISPR module RAMP protein Cmr4 [Acidiphilium sp.]
MPDSAAILYLHAITSLHPGSGTALGVVDLPIQRERHTAWPVVPGSSVKGVLRETMRGPLANNLWTAIFGPETAQAALHAGAVTFTDARLLAFPVRSLKGVFAWVTCKAALDRYARDLALAGIKPDGLVLSEEPEPGKMLVAQDSPILIDGNAALLEEFDFSRAGDAAKIAAWLSGHAGVDKAARCRLQSHLVVLNDSDFTHFAVHATEVLARVGLDAETRTVRNGALFYEEFLPPETILYAVLLAAASRQKDANTSGAGLLAEIRKNLPPTLQIGAGETIGKGLVAISLRGAEARQ